MSKNPRAYAKGIAKLFKTNDPYEIADRMDIIVQEGAFGSIGGCCMKICGTYFIYVDRALSLCQRKVIVAHELGHIFLHGEELAFYSSGKCYTRSTLETDAQTFAAELLISDEWIEQNRDLTLDEMEQKTGYQKQLLVFKRNLQTTD